MKYGEFRNRRDISQGRKMLYYGGLALMAAGLLFFLSVFVSTAVSMDRPTDFTGGPSFMVRGVIGFVMILLGAILRGVGARGLAGSGVVLDPERAREDLAPYASAIGGMARDAVESFKANGGEKEEETLVMVR